MFYYEAKMSQLGDTAVPFKGGSPIFVAGPTNSGKSFWVYRLLATPKMFEQPIASILYCYGVYQPLYNVMKNNPNFPSLEFQEGLPSKEDIEKLTYDDKFHIIVLDDLMEKVVKNLEMQELILQHCHHMNITAILLSQNVFQGGRYSRSITLNVHNMILFANKRDESQVHALARQLFPVEWRSFVKVYREVTSKAYAYLLIDCTPSHPRSIQIRTQIFPPDICTVFNIC